MSDYPSTVVGDDVSSDVTVRIASVMLNVKALHSHGASGSNPSDWLVRPWISS